MPLLTLDHISHAYGHLPLLDDVSLQIQPGERVEILRGPECEDGLTWWEIRSLSSSLKGWTPEGDESTYWLIPED